MDIKCHVNKTLVFEFMLPIFAELKSLWTFKSESENVSKVRHCFKEERVEGMGKFLNHFL